MMRLDSLGYRLVDCSDDTKLQMASFSQLPDLALVPLTNQVNLSEVKLRIQALREKFPDIPVFGVCSTRVRFKSNEIYSAGFNGYYQSPFEEDLFVNKVFELAPVDPDTADLKFEQLMRVNIVELEKVQKLEFNVYIYLPMNQKIILYLEANRGIDERVIKKFKENAHYALYIHRADYKKYLKYCSSLLNQSREKEAEFKSQLSGMMKGFFTDEQMTEEESRGLLESMRSLLDGLEDRSGSKKDLVQSVSRYASQQLTHYSHAQNVAAYCSLFGMALGIQEPETLKLGGLMHDLGLSDLPSHLIGQDLAKMSDEDAAKYRLHPGGGKYSIEERKLAVPPMVIDMVLYHHERPDGSGYPYGKKAAEIPPAAKVCAFADEFDKLTSVRPGYRQLSPVEAIKRIAGLDGRPPESVFEAAFHRPLIDLFLSSEASGRNGVEVGAAASAKAETGVSVVPGARRPAKVGLTIQSLLASDRHTQHKNYSFDMRQLSSQEILKDLSEQLAAHFKLLEDRRRFAQDDQF